jgi:Putative auto-transporter adhesin, head GIN domain
MTGMSMRVQLAVVAGALWFGGAALAKSEERQVSSFDTVHIASGLHATITLGSQKPVLLEGDDESLAEIEAVVEHGELRVGYRQHDGHGHWHHGERTVHVTIQTAQLRALTASGGSDVTAALSRSDETEIEASGGSVLHLTGVDAGRLTIRASGGSILDVGGRGDNLDLHLSGGSHLKGHGLAVRDLRVRGSGGSVAELRATGAVSGGLSGGSEVHVRGGARGQLSTSGGSSLQLED